MVGTSVVNAMYELVWLCAVPVAYAHFATWPAPIIVGCAWAPIVYPRPPLDISLPRDSIHSSTLAIVVG